MIESAAARPMLFPVSTSQSAGIAMAQPAMADAMRTSRVGRRLEFINPPPPMSTDPYRIVNFGPR